MAELTRASITPDREAILGRYRLPLRLGVLLAAAVMLAWALWIAAEERTLTVAYPTRGLAVAAVYATGTVESSVTIRIAPQVAGRIVELDADEGQTVKAGGTLARLDDSDIRATVAELEARARYAEQQYERIEALLKQGWVTREKFDQARSELDAAHHAVRRASEQMRFMSLTTPAEGQVIRRDGEVGDFIPSNQPVFYLAKAGSPLRISADVDEEDIPLVKAGDKVLIKADAFPDRIFDGQVSDVTPKGDPVARSYRVRIALPPDTALKIGMTAETNIITKESPNALLVPATALDIAIMKSVGFRARDILFIFLTEGAIVGTIGSALGTGLGFAMMSALSRIEIKTPFDTGRTFLPIDWGWESVALGIAFAMTSALVAAFLPARKGARVHPVDILRGAA